jgi:D-sedoheptulose 7-phosphate isomerase
MTAAGPLFATRTGPTAALVDDAAAIAAAARALAERLAAGATLYAVGVGAAAADAEHIAVEFVHPVVVGKRALPARAVVDRSRVLASAAPGDVVVGVSCDGRCPVVAEALAEARAGGLLGIALVGGDGGPIAAEGLADHCVTVRSDDALVVRELHVTLYHLMWELVHVFLESGPRR